LFCGSQNTRKSNVSRLFFIYELTPVSRLAIFEHLFNLSESIPPTVGAKPKTSHKTKVFNIGETENMAKAKAKAAAKTSAKAKKTVFFFGGGKAEGMTVAKTESERKMILGGKGAGLSDMTAAGLPVPPGFTISVPNCEEYYRLGRKISNE